MKNDVFTNHIFHIFLLNRCFKQLNDCLSQLGRPCLSRYHRCRMLAGASLLSLGLYRQFWVPHTHFPPAAAVSFCFCLCRRLCCVGVAVVLSVVTRCCFRCCRCCFRRCCGCLRCCRCGVASGVAGVASVVAAVLPLCCGFRCCRCSGVASVAAVVNKGRGGI